MKSMNVSMGEFPDMYESLYESEPQMDWPEYTFITKVAHGYNGLLTGLMQSNVIEVQQIMNFLNVFGKGCCNFSNQYAVQAPGQLPMFYAAEDAECFNKLCCKPCHTFNIVVVPTQESTRNDLMPFVQRPGFPNKFTCCFTASDFCRSNATIFGGVNVGTAVMYEVEEKTCNGLTPEFTVFAKLPNGEKISVANVRGPGIFGGCADLCCDAPFDVTCTDTLGNPIGPLGNIARIAKVKPSTCCELITEACTDVDNYVIEFNPGCPLNTDPNFRAAVLGTMFLLDAQFFSYDMPIINSDGNGGCYLTLFMCYCAGCNLPCQLHIPRQK